MTVDRMTEAIGIADLSSAFSDGGLSPKEYVRGLLEKIEARKSLNAFITVTGERALEEAAEAEDRYRAHSRRGPLDGVPIALKDIIHTKGIRTTFGCAAYRDYIPEDDAFIVKRLKDAGAVLIGKTNTSQFAMGPMGDVSFVGPCRNPHDESRITGGSSSGSAAAVAAALCPGAVGTDTGGSIRMPASLCGCVGLKPTFSLVSAEGIMPLSTTLDCPGPLTRTVRDSAILLGVLAGYNPRDCFSAPVPARDYTAGLGDSVRGCRVAVDYSAFETDLDPDVRDGQMGALKALEAVGCRIKPITFPDMGEFRGAHQRILVAGGHQEHKRDMAEHPGDILEQVRGRLDQGDLSSDQYIADERLKNAFRAVMLGLMRDCDVLALPSTPIAASKIGETHIPLNGKPTEVITAYPRFTWIANYSGFPAISIPVGFTREGLPVGFSLLARPYAEADLLRVAHALEQELGLRPVG